MEWEKLSLNFKLSILSGHTFIDAYVLGECDELMQLLKNGASQEDCEKCIENNL